MKGKAPSVPSDGSLGFAGRSELMAATVFITSYLTTANNVGRLREHVDDFPLAFVTPLRADDDRHLVQRFHSGAFRLRHSIDTGTRRHVDSMLISGSRRFRGRWAFARAATLRIK